MSIMVSLCGPLFEVRFFTCRTCVWCVLVWVLRRFVEVFLVSIASLVFIVGCGCFISFSVGLLDGDVAVGFDWCVFSGNVVCVVVGVIGIS